MGWLTKIGQLGQTIGGFIGGDTGRTITQIGQTAGDIGQLFGSPGGTPPSPGFAPQMPTGLPSLPRFPGMFGNGGNGGSPNVPMQMNGTNGHFQDDISTLLGGDRIVMEPRQKVINTAPPGWVIVDMPDGSGKKAVRKEVARCLGLWKSRSKPPISASDWKKLKTANRVRNKAKKIAQTADFKCTKK